MDESCQPRQLVLVVKPLRVSHVPEVPSRRLSQSALWWYPVQTQYNLAS